MTVILGPSPQVPPPAVVTPELRVAVVRLLGRKDTPTYFREAWETNERSTT